VWAEQQETGEGVVGGGLTAEGGAVADGIARGGQRRHARTTTEGGFYGKGKGGRPLLWAQLRDFNDRLWGA